ncbi:hypothetical protein [Allomuricauda sp. SCSIO 65647]|uniref:hypothetical protein n=1 Tax=Allomuricauda sp. SCSIO 65647 TaxID=2908843 RepID=UPI001F1EFF26|nr:hypothetical protein [Muricauda sp. SCSIO 65647]UJH67610.1 hypothetical protein L0P89_16895 [Muricauda sp. SCSIO 65647]
MGEAYRLVTYIMAGFAVVYVALEIVLNLNEVDNDTSNIILFEAAKDKLFFIPFGLGAIMGHLFLGVKTDYFGLGDGLPVIILFSLAAIMTLIGFKVPFKKPVWFLSILLILGLFYGHLFWSMNF